MGREGEPSSGGYLKGASGESLEGSLPRARGSKCGLVGGRPQGGPIAGTRMCVCVG